MRLETRESLYTQKRGCKRFRQREQSVIQTGTINIKQCSKILRLSLLKKIARRGTTFPRGTKIKVSMMVSMDFALRYMRFVAS